MENKFPGPQDARAAIITLLRYIGDNPNRDGLKDTPERILRALNELLGGYRDDPKKILKRSFQVLAPDEQDQMIVLAGIEFTSFCEHHCLPFRGRAHIGYIPASSTVVGISKLARLVDIFARRLQVQERLTAQIAKTIEEVLATRGVAVVIEAQHQCMTTRGARKPGAVMVTTFLRGAFKDDPKTREEFLESIRGHRLAKS